MQTEPKQPHNKANLQQDRQIFERRKEIERELVDVLKEIDLTPLKLRRGEEQFALQYVKDLIYNEEDKDDFHNLIAMFDGLVSLTAGRDGDISELNDVLKLVTDAWNYFPHKVLDGISPVEVILKHRQE